MPGCRDRCRNPPTKTLPLDPVEMEIAFTMKMLFVLAENLRDSLCVSVKFHGCQLQHPETYSYLLDLVKIKKNKARKTSFLSFHLVNIAQEDIV